MSSNRQARRAHEAKLRKTKRGLDQLGVVAQKLKGLEALPDALKDVQAILAAVNEARMALSMAIQDIGEHTRRLERLEYMVEALAMASGHSNFVARIGAEYDAAHTDEPVQEEAPVEPTPET